MYSLDVAHWMNVFASFGCVDEAGMARAQDQSHCAPFGASAVGAGANATLSATFDSFGFARYPAATVASIHIAHLPLAKRARFSLWPFELAPGGPYFFIMST